MNEFAPKLTIELNNASIDIYPDCMVFRDPHDGTACQMEYSDLFKLVERHGDWDED